MMFIAAFVTATWCSSLAPAPDPGDGVDLLADCSPSSTQVETAIAIDPADPDHIVVACMDWGGVAQVVKHSVTFDGGATWACNRLRLDAGFMAQGDPELSFDTNGDVHLLYLAALGPGGNSIRIRRSSDGGLTFGKANVISTDTADDKPKIATCRAAVAHHGRLVVTWMKASSSSTPDRIVTAFSDDFGRNWSLPVIVNDVDASGGREGGGSDLAFASDGDLFLCWQDEAPHELWCDRSADGGVTFGTDRLVASYANTPNPLPGFAFDCKPVFAMSVDATGGTYDGRIYFAWHDWNTAGAILHADVKLSTSSDDGQTWTTILANPGDSAPTDQLMPDVDVDPWGGVNLIWHDRRSDPVGTTLELWGGRSLDGGATIATELALADAPFDPASDRFGGVFIGHYNALASRPQGAVPCWADNRAGADSEDVFIDPWNTGLTTSSASLSAATGGRVDLAISPGPNLAGASYLVLATLSGTVPPLVVDGVAIDLVWDDLTTQCWLCPDNGPLWNGIGILAADGTAAAALDSLGPFDPTFAGEVVHVVVVLFDANGDVAHATAPERIDLVP